MTTLANGRIVVSSVVDWLAKTPLIASVGAAANCRYQLLLNISLRDMIGVDVKLASVFIPLGGR